MSEQSKQKVTELVLELHRAHPRESQEQLMRRLLESVKRDPELMEGVAAAVLDGIYEEDASAGKEPPFRKPP